MPELQRYNRTAKIAKFLIPSISRVLPSAQIQSVISLGETGAALLQGKGAGSGWDLNAEVTAALKFIHPGATVFDVGANKGEWSRAVRERMGDVRLFLFEPQAACAPYKEIDGATLTQAAVGEANGRAILHSPCDAAGNASLHMRGDSYFAGQTLRIRRGCGGLDQLVHGSACYPVDRFHEDGYRRPRTVRPQRCRPRPGEGGHSRTVL